MKLRERVATLLLLLVLANFSSALRCPSPDWYYKKGTNNCYFVHGSAIEGSISDPTGPVSTLETWTDAVTDCKIRGGKIATFENAEELEWLKAKLASAPWYWIGLTYENLSWQWYDGETYRPYTPIPTLNVVDPTGSDAEKRLYRGSLTYRYGTSKFEFSLQRATTSNTNGYICKGDWSSKPWCKVEDGWTYWNGTCYQYRPSSDTFWNAQEECLYESGYISVPSTLEKDSRMKEWLRTTMRLEEAWIGISISPKTAETTTDTVKWADGSSFNGLPINNWEVDDMDAYIRNLTNGKTYCGQLSTRKSGWGVNDYEADKHDWSLTTACDSLNAVVCEAPLNKCPYGWRMLDDQCYQFNLGDDNLRTWQAARADCQKQNADLVVIKSRRVAFFLENFLEHNFNMQRPRNQYWIGIENKGANFSWVDGSSLDFTNWSELLPSPMPSPGKCVYLAEVGYSSLMKGEDWEIASCNQQFNFICEAHFTADIQPDDVIQQDHTCTPPFVKYHEGCYLVVKEKMKRDAAQERCQANQGSVLAILRTFGENVWLRNQVSGDAWIGLKIVGTSTTSGSTSNEFIYQYSDGTEVVKGTFFNNFEDSMYSSDRETTNKYCVAFAGNNSEYSLTTYSKASFGKWYHADCTEMREFVCYNQGTPQVVAPTYENKDDPQCGAGWQRNGDNCYRIYINAAPWRLAKQTCQNADATADLLWITTKEEALFINSRNFGQGRVGLWIGLYADSGASNWYWPYRKYANKWHVPMAVTRWAPGYPTIPMGSRTPQCAYTQWDYTDYPAQWMTASCADRKEFICKKTLPSSVSAITTTPTPTAVPGQTLGCRDGWINMEGRCIYYNIQRLSWLDARTFCRSLGGDLFTVDSDADFDVVKTFTMGAWVGLNTLVDSVSPRVYAWSDGSAMTFTPWDVQAHNASLDSIRDINCGALTAKGYTMYSCAETKPSLCRSKLTSVNSSTPTGIPVPHDRGCEIWGYGFHDRCYYFGEDPNSQSVYRPFNTFDAARDFCRSRFNADLVSINNFEEQEFINALTARFASEYWIGLQEETNAFRKWVDGTYVSRANWAFAEPKRASEGAKRCVAMHGLHSETVLPGDWYVDSCVERKLALCEGGRTWHPPHPTLPPPPTTVKPIGCPTGWRTRDYGGGLPNCYKAYLGRAATEVKKVTWQQAEDFCRRFRNGHLATIETLDEQNFVTSILPSDSDLQSWIGLRQNGAQNKWEWADGRPLTSTFNFWYSDKENHETDQPDCVAVDVLRGRWIPQSCQQAWGWVCEIPKGIYTADQLIENFPAAIEPNGTCGTSTSEGEWFYSPDTDDCFYLSRKADSWNSAQATCRAMGSNLVTVTSQSHAFITLKASQFSPKRTRFWIGLYQTDPSTQEHIWIDRHVSLFRAWEYNEPQVSGTEQCVAHNSWSGKWRDENCARSLQFICHKSDRVPPSPPPTADQSIGECPIDWVEYRNACYFFSGPVNKTFNEAFTACTREISLDKGYPRADLVSIHSSLENDFLVSQAWRVPYRGNDRMYDSWVGLRDHNSDNILLWTDQTPLDYNNWHIREPYVYEPNDCTTFATEIVRAGRWSITDCDSRRGYICKAPKDLNAPKLPSAPTNCSAGYTPNGKNCFIIQKLNEGQKKYADAKAKCQSLGDRYGDMATVVDNLENAALRVLLHELMRNDGVNHSKAWMGMQEHMGQYSWDNTCPVTYSNFENLYARPGQNSSCVQMLSDGKWNGTSCNAEADYVLCERRFVPCPDFHNIGGENLFCPVDFPQECNRTCYRVVTKTNHHNTTELNNIRTANASCTALGGHLASIRSESDQNCLLEYTKYATQGMWIGLYEKKVGNTYSWVWSTDDEIHLPSTYVNWDASMPRIYEYSRDTCVEMLPSGKWVNRYCSATFSTDDKGYICEHSKEWRDVQRRTTGLPPHLVDQGKDGGPSSGTVAGIVIGVLIAVALVGGVGFIVKTGRTESVLTSVRSAGSRLKSAATTRKNAPGFAGFSNSTYDHADKVRLGKESDVSF